MFSKKLGIGSVLLSGLIGVAGSLARVSFASDPAGLGIARVESRGGGGQPDPLLPFNQHVELADGELYLLKGAIVMAPGLTGASHKPQPYLSVDLRAQPWLSGKQRKQSPLYMIESGLSSWRPQEGAYGEIAAEAHVHLFVSPAGTPVEVISLKPIPELSSIQQQD